MTSVSTLSQYSRVLRDITGVKDRQTDLQRQLSTGYKSNTYSGLGLDADRSLRLRESVGRVETFKRNIDMVKVRTEVADTAMRRVGDLAKQVMADINKLDGTIVSDPTVTRDLARQALRQVASLLNTQVEGTYIFAGSDDANPPVNDLTAYETTVQRFYDTYISAPLAPDPPDPPTLTPLDFDNDGVTGVTDLADAGGDEDDSFGLNDADSNLAAYIFDGTDSDIDVLSNALNRLTFDPEISYQPGMAGVGTIYRETLRYGTAPVAAKVDENLTVPYAVRADATYFRKIIQGLAMVAAADRPDPPADPDDPDPRDRYRAMLQEARDVLASGTSDLDTAVSAVGGVRRTIEALEEKHIAVIGVAKEALGRVEDADVATVATNLNLVETQLQAGYRTIAGLNRVSILDFLS